MNVLDRLLGVIGLQTRASFSKANPRDPIVAEWFGGGTQTAAGVTVTPEQSIRLSAVFACVRLLSSTISSLPLHVYIRVNGGREKAESIPLYDVLHSRPNRWQTSYEWRQMMAVHLLLRGNGYSEIVSSRQRPVSELIPLHPDRVTPFRAPDGSVAYEYREESGEQRIILQDEMHHLRGMSFDGIRGLSPIEEARETVGLTMAAEEFGGRYFANGTVAGGVLQAPAALSDRAYERLKSDWERRQQGLANAHNPAILEEGMTWNSLGIPPDQAQFLETRKFQVAEIARMFGVPPHMIGDVEKTTSWGSGVEQQGIGFVIYSLRPWLVSWEQAIHRDLMTENMRRTHYAEFSVTALLRGDSKARAEYYKSLHSVGAITQNEIRSFENMNPIPGGDKVYLPLNTAPPDSEAFRALHRGVFRQAIDRIVTAEVKALRRALKSGNAAEFERRAAEFYDGFHGFSERVLAPVMNGNAKKWIDGHKRDSLSEITSLLGSDHPLDAIGGMIDRWEDYRVDLIETEQAERAYQEIKSGH